MSFDPLDFLTLAKGLASGAPNEASIRTAIGRAYYGVFLLAREGTHVLGRKDVHKKVQKRVGEKIGRAAADKLDSFLTLRCKADYDLSPSMTAKDWHRAEWLASHLLSKIRKI